MIRPLEAVGERPTALVSARRAADAAWARLGAGGTGASLQECFAAEAVVRRTYDRLTGAVLRLHRAVTAPRSRERHPTSA